MRTFLIKKDHALRLIINKKLSYFGNSVISINKYRQFINIIPGNITKILSA